MKALEFINLYLEHFNNDDFDSLKSFFAYPLYMNVNGNIITVNESPMEQMKKSSDLGKTEDIEVEVIKETEDQAHRILRDAKRYNKSVKNANFEPNVIPIMKTAKVCIVIGTGQNGT